MRLAIAVACAVVGCGRIDFDPLADDDAPSPEVVDGYASGSRLKIMWNEIEDGTRSYTSVYDSVLDEVCIPIPWADGVTRCSPAAELTYHFLDAACTQPVAAVPPGGIVPPMTYELDWCAGLPRLFSVGAAITPPAVYTQTFSTCGLSSSSGWTYHTLTEIPADRYVPLTMQSSIESAPLSLRSYTADDGFRLPASFRDQRVGDCLPTTNEPVVRCRPGTSTGNTHGDAGCTQSLAVSLCAAPQPYYSVDACSSEVRAPAAPYTGPTWVLNGSTCTSSSLMPPATAYSLGPPITVEDLETQIGVHPGRRTQNIYDGRGPARLRRSRVYDTALDIECEPRLAADGVMRCLPTDVGVTSDFFSDAACTTPIKLIGVVGPCGGAATGPALALEYVTASGAYSVVEGGPEYTGPIYRVAGGCVPGNVGSGVSYFIAGPSVALETFAASTVVTDP